MAFVWLLSSLSRSSHLKTVFISHIVLSRVLIVNINPQPNSWLFLADPCLMSVNWNYYYAVSVSIVLQSSRNITSLCWVFPPNSRYGFGWLCPTSHQNNLPDCSSSPQVQANFPQGDLPIWNHFFRLHQHINKTLFQLLILVSIWFVCQTTQVFNRLKRPCSRPSMMAAKDLN